MDSTPAIFEPRSSWTRVARPSAGGRWSRVEINWTPIGPQPDRRSHSRKSRNPLICRHFSRGERGDSNPRPPGPQPGALPTELRPPCDARAKSSVTHPVPRPADRSAFRPAQGSRWAQARRTGRGGPPGRQEPPGIAAEQRRRLGTEGHRVSGGRASRTGGPPCAAWRPGCRCRAAAAPRDETRSVTSCALTLGGGPALPIESRSSGIRAFEDDQFASAGSISVRRR